ncbi:reverse transcriptase domain-containing protein [Streptomyces bobili]|uniref:reverse transcriptase domain-containing protein n=1 Tax=Streptomyces bobili TaxID=67280 RepID=UPI0033B7B739
MAAHLEKQVEPVFHPDSYGYRPGRSALNALEACRRRCWKKKWAVDLDVSKFFDSVRWDLVIKAVETHTDAAWVVLYVKRWLAAPGATSRRHLAAARSRNPTGIGGFSRVGESVSALCVRSVALPELSGRRVRTLCG